MHDRSNLTHWALILLAITIVLASVAPADACPMCKAALASEGEGDLASGFFYSILFMLSMPFLIFGGMGAYMYLLVRRARAEREAAAAMNEPATADGPSVANAEREPEPVEV